MTHNHITPVPAFALTRRAALAGIGAALAMGHVRVAHAAVTFPQRLVIINLLGGLDGMAAVVPYGDINLASLRAPLIPPPVGKAGGMYDLGGFFGLNPAMPNLYGFYQAGQMLAVHAVGNVVNTRSHFQGQNALQAGTSGTITDGWINRLVGLLSTAPGGVEAGLTLGPSCPLISQGASLMGGWSSPVFPSTPTTLAALVETLGTADPLIGNPTQSGFNDALDFKTWLQDSSTAAGKSTLQTAARAAGVFLAASGGPAVIVVQDTSFDTHINQLTELPPMLSDLDAAIALLASAAGTAWANTVVLTITEFGRTAYVNGCGGTDHGTGLAMFLAGGAVAGGPRHCQLARSERHATAGRPRPGAHG